MCRDQVPELTAEAAAGRLAERYDVPELVGDFLGRERTRDHGKFLKTEPGWRPAPISEQPGRFLDPGAVWRFIHDGRSGPSGWLPR